MPRTTIYRQSLSEWTPSSEACTSRGISGLREVSAAPSSLVPLWTKGSAAGNAQHVWRKAPTFVRQFSSWATCSPGMIGMGNCFRTRIWSAGDAFLAPPGSRTLAPFFRPTAQTGALFARAVVCATVTSSARVLSMVLVASRGRRTNVVAWVNLFWHLQAILPIPQQNLFDTLCRELSSNFTSPAPTTCA